jgi:hypothetical protein
VLLRAALAALLDPAEMRLATVDGRTVGRGLDPRSGHEGIMKPAPAENQPLYKNSKLCSGSEARPSPGPLPASGARERNFVGAMKVGYSRT